VTLTFDLNLQFRSIYRGGAWFQILRFDSTTAKTVKYCSIDELKTTKHRRLTQPLRSAGPRARAPLALA